MHKQLTCEERKKMWSNEILGGKRAEMESEMGQNQSQVAHDHSVADSWSFTSIEKEMFSHRWNINNFKEAVEMLKKGDRLLSNVFLGGKTAKHKWVLTLENSTEEGQEYVGVFLLLHAIGKNHRGKTLIASAEYSILDANNKPICQLGGNGECTIDYIESNKRGIYGWGYSTFLKISDLMDEPTNYLVGDELKISCRIWLNVALKTYETLNQTSVVSSTLDSPPLKRLRTAYKKMLKTRDYHDVVIKTATNEFKVHKAVLAVRSRVFAAMLKTEMQEAKSGIIFISDFSDNVIQEMLNFVYSGEVENMKENIAELFTIADKYDVHDLKNECIRNIPSALTCENAVDVFLSMSKYHLPELKPLVAQYIARNTASVKNTTALPDGVKELISALL